MWAIWHAIAKPMLESLPIFAPQMTQVKKRFHDRGEFTASGPALAIRFSPDSRCVCATWMWADSYRVEGAIR
jgi:hypothetical protein